jgi:hypothetical protein
LRRKTLEVEFFCEFESIFETALDHESEDQLGSFSAITLDKKISRYCPLNLIQSNIKGLAQLVKGLAQFRRGWPSW